MKSDLARVANDFILKAYEENLYLLPTKLLKLVYFMYGHYLQRTGDILFDAKFNALEHGPVIFELYDCIKGLGDVDQFLESEDGKLYITNRNSEYGKKYYDVFNYVWNKYRLFSVNTLSNLTHAPNSPWDVTRRIKGKNKEIDAELIKRYFKGEDISNG